MENTRYTKLDNLNNIIITYKRKNKGHLLKIKDYLPINSMGFNVKQYRLYTIDKS